MDREGFPNRSNSALEVNLIVRLVINGDLRDGDLPVPAIPYISAANFASMVEFCTLFQITGKLKSHSVTFVL